MEMAGDFLGLELDSCWFWAQAWGNMVDVRVIDFECVSRGLQFGTQSPLVRCCFYKWHHPTLRSLSIKGNMNPTFDGTDFYQLSWLYVIGGFKFDASCCASTRRWCEADVA
jgi:hypothetical protein